VFSWSYRALAPASARAFRFLGLHPGQDISIAAAAALLGAPFPQARQLLRSLASGHLLEETGQDRYQFHDLVRVYAAERARASDPEPHRTAAVRRLLTWYLHAADAFERVFNPDHALLPLGTPPSWCKPPAFTTHLQAWRWAESEFANLGPVLRRAATAGDDVLAWQLPAAFMIIYDLSGRMAELIPALRSALATSRELGDRAAQAQILRHLAEACMNAGQLDEAIGCCRDAFAIYTETGDWYGQWSARQKEGRACLSSDSSARPPTGSSSRWQPPARRPIPGPRACP
jgi:tetratricopeptide (TPR) repeat protein